MTTTIHSIESMAALDGEAVRFGVFTATIPTRGSTRARNTLQKRLQKKLNDISRILKTAAV